MFQEILKRAVSLRASDIHLKVGKKPVVRASKKLKILEDFPQIDQRIMNEFLREVLSKSKKKQQELIEEGQTDLSYSLPGVGRFRVNVFRQRGTYAMALRYIPYEVPKFSALSLPPVILKETLNSTKGLILVTGPTGSGKSTTLASLINEINQRLERVIITIEDPIEFLHRDIKSYVVQREVGMDTESFAKGLRAALREDPDIILVGEIRDPETAKIALQAAETGHLVLSTLHTLDAKETVNRIVGMFNLEVREQIRLQLASVLVMIVSQRLLPKLGGGMVPAVEILVNKGAIKEALLDPNRLDEIPQLLERGKASYQTQTFDQHLEELYRAGKIDMDTALLYASKPGDLEMKLKGISF